MFFVLCGYGIAMRSLNEYRSEFKSTHKSTVMYLVLAAIVHGYLEFKIFKMRLYPTYYIWGFQFPCVIKELCFQWICSLMVNLAYLFSSYLCLYLLVDSFVIYTNSMAVIVESLFDRHVVWLVWYLFRIVTRASGSLINFLVCTLTGNSKGALPMLNPGPYGKLL